MITKLIILLVIAGSAIAQSYRDSVTLRRLLEEIDRRQGTDAQQLDPFRVENVVEGELFGGQLGIRCEFQTLPQPLTNTKALLTFSVEKAASIASWPDLELVFRFSERDLEWLSESSVLWPGPKQQGDVLTALVEFKPLTSGHRGFSIEVAGRYNDDTRILWCLNEDGVLESLGEPSQGGLRCNALRSTTFFEGDSVTIRPWTPKEPDRFLFTPLVTVSPLFRIGDTTTIHYSLTAVRDVPDDIEITLEFCHFELIDVPRIEGSSLSKGQTLEFDVRTLPLAVRDVHKITLVIRRRLPGRQGYKSEQAVPCSVMFGTDGLLKYVSAYYLGKDIDQARLPETFPNAQDLSLKRVRITRRKAR
ncbi:MAG: hypothetical protein JSU65_14485 [Candidatus Zixiibacteriota bacterium]|nr:MAG: hypothetical protein JSU65_14485 [candidate division Zixibacteria bacterium]